MNSFLKTNKKLFIYSSIFLIIIPFFGLNLILSFIGNILLVIFLVPVLLLIIGLIGFRSLRSNINLCNKCGFISLGSDANCMNCGAELNKKDFQKNQIYKKPSESTIEVKAEEIK
tara:strand:+ start:234 stop:578 length:345 start_codon:yes stop_codon:yes gene_type:complete